MRFVVRRGLASGWTRGVVGGNRAWLVVGGVAVVGHLAGRAAGREADVVFSEPLGPGESFRVTHLRRP